MKRPVLTGLEDYLELLRRRRTWIFVSFLLLAVPACWVTLILPDIYVSETLILVEPRDVPEDVVKDFVMLDAEQRLVAIQETVLSRTNMLRVINEFREEFDELRGLNDQTRVETLRSRIEINVTRTRRGQNTMVPYFTISYRDRDPATAQRVANRLVSLFIEQDSRTREAQVFGTVDFLRNEVQKVAEQLRVAEEELAQIKSRHQHELPDQLETNLRTLDRLQDQLKANIEGRDRYLSMKLDLERQLSETPQQITQEQYQKATGRTVPSGPTLVDQLRAKEETLKQLSAAYTHKHPDVQRLTREIEGLKQTIPLEELEKKVEAEATPEPAKVPNPLYTKIISQLQQVTTELDILDERRSWIEQEIEVYLGRVRNTPAREQEIALLNRRYEALSRQHDDLKGKLTQAELAESLESRQKGEQFQIVDPASFPVAPAEPNRVLVLLISLLGAAASAIVLSLGREVADERIWNSHEVEKLLGVPVIAQVPVILTPRELVARKRRSWAGLLLLGLLFVACLGAVYVVYSSPDLRSYGSEVVAGLMKY